MSVCMSAVLAGISEVLIKYTGNVWLHYILNNSLATVSAVEFNKFMFVSKYHYHLIPYE